MADRTLFFDDLLTQPNVRAKSYIVQEPPGHGLTCVELSARRADDWYYARKWLSTRGGRRLLYWLLDEVEGRGFRFRILSRASGEGRPEQAAEAWQRARASWAELSEEERRIHRELFPQEEALLARGYDWDHEAVYRDERRLPCDAVGRCLEEDGGVVHEWVRVPDEWTWRRYPLYALAPPPAGLRAASPESAAY